MEDTTVTLLRLLNQKEPTWTWVMGLAAMEMDSFLEVVRDLDIPDIF